MCHYVLILCECKKPGCGTIYGSFRDDDESTFCDRHGEDESEYLVRARARVDTANANDTQRAGQILNIGNRRSVEPIKHKIRVTKRIEEADEYCEDCEIELAGHRAANRALTRERREEWEHQRILREQRGREAQRQARQAREREERERQRDLQQQRVRQAERQAHQAREREEYQKTGRWPGRNMNTGFGGSKDYMGRKGF